MKKRFAEEQIIGCLKAAGAGMPVKELCRSTGFSDASFHPWRAKFGGMGYLKLADSRTWTARTRGSRICCLERWST